MSEQIDSLPNELQLGNSSAYEELYERFKSEALCVAYSQLYDFFLAEDAVQEAFMRLPSALNNYRSKCSLKYFILGVVHNAAREIRRKRLFYVPFNDALRTRARESCLEELLFIKETLPKLNKKEQEAILLHLQAELTFKEMAQLLKMPESTIKSRYQKGIAHLREMLNTEC